MVNATGAIGNLEACTSSTTRTIFGLMWQGSLDTLTADCRQNTNRLLGSMQPALITAPGAACRFRLAFGGRLETRCRSWLSPSLARLQRSAADPTIKVVCRLPKICQESHTAASGCLYLALQGRCFGSKTPVVCSVHAALEGVAQKIQDKDTSQSEVSCARTSFQIS